VKISNETKVGALTVIAITLLVLGYNFLKGKDIFTDTHDYYAKYENINGIKVSNPVLYNGFSVGKVTALSLNENGEVIATLTLQPELKIPVNSIAKIASQDLLGAKAIVLLFSDARTYHQEGDTLQSDVEMSLSESVNTQVLPVKAKAEKLLGTMDSILVTVQTILNPNFRNNIDESFSSIKRSIETLEKTATRIDTLVKFQSARFASITLNIESITSNLKNNNQKITDILTNVNQISDSIAKINFIATIDNANRAIAQVASITEKINNGQGSLGLLVNDEALYNHINQSAADLDKLMVDLRLNPKRYVHLSLFGGKNKKYKEPTVDTASVKKSK
jgi:phospholipid/cholesterol/gamma-HCH transport system substrate-binding protein